MEKERYTANSRIWYQADISNDIHIWLDANSLTISVKKLCKTSGPLADLNMLKSNLELAEKQIGRKQLEFYLTSRLSELTCRELSHKSAFH